MGGTILGYCSSCGMAIDYDPLLGGHQYCDDCLNGFDDKQDLIDEKISYELQHKQI